MAEQIVANRYRLGAILDVAMALSTISLCDLENVLGLGKGLNENVTPPCNPPQVIEGGCWGIAGNTLAPAVIWGCPHDYALSQLSK